MRSAGRHDPPEGARRPGAEGPPSDEARGRAAALEYVTAGVQFGGVLLAFTALGYWLDTRWNTLPILTLLGAAAGGVGGFVHLYRSLTARSERDPAP